MEEEFNIRPELESPIEEKIEKICKKIYGAEKVILSEEAQNSIKMIEN